MSTNIGSISVGMNVNLAEFEAGMTKATAIARSNTQLMSAEMKRQSREGSESLRLIDEAIGVHISRPLTRLIGQTQLVGAALSAVFAFSAGAAIATVFFEQGKRLLEMTGALQIWKEWLGLAGETAEETAKRMTTADDQIIKRLKEKTELQDAYNQLVLGLKGGDFERAHLDSLKHETEELRKQVILQTAQAQAKANEGVNWWKLGALALSPELVLMGLSPTNDVQKAQVEANKFAEGMKPIFERLHELQIELQKGGWKIFADDAEAAKQAIADDQEQMKGWNQEANAAWKEWTHINEQLDKATEKMNEGALASGAARFAEFTKIQGGLGVAPPPGAPMLKDQAELLKITNDQNEAWRKAGEILEQIETPQQKYATGLAVLNELQSRLTPEQYALALQKLNEEMVRSASQMQRMQKELERVLEHSDSARAGVQAFFLQMQIDAAQNGRFAFEILSQGLKGFEDETAKALTGAKTNWRSFFEQLDQMALKFVLNKELTSLLKAFSGTGLGQSLGLDKLLGSTVKDTAQLANTTALGVNTGVLGVNTAAISVLTAALSASSAIGGAGAGAGSATGFAAGSDYTPGGMAWVGERGPELLNLPAGSSITPAASVRSGGGITQHFHIDAKGAEIGVEEKIARAIQQAAPSIALEAVVRAAEVNRRTPH